MDVFAILIVGLITGLLANLFFGGSGYGLPSDIAIATVGALLGNWMVGWLGAPVPHRGAGGTGSAAFSGAAALLVLLRGFRSARRTRDLWTRSPSSSSPWR